MREHEHEDASFRQVLSARTHAKERQVRARTGKRERVRNREREHAWVKEKDLRVRTLDFETVPQPLYLNPDIKRIREAPFSSLGLGALGEPSLHQTIKG